MSEQDRPVPSDIFNDFAEPVNGTKKRVEQELKEAPFVTVSPSGEVYTGVFIDAGGDIEPGDFGEHEQVIFEAPNVDTTPKGSMFAPPKNPSNGGFGQ